ncbi:cell division protein FtsQ/DivIB [Haloferula sp. A504]|uniref:cell division protein FtsQ/DivIB n=1 Tax=Haloferula sp. A504 TaxID=3373601 RepID=UPI0031C034A1|nr:FtsQ-type POTRA domain-containing protein [Verrucomicrobiaceae bacterium E54]
MFRRRTSKVRKRRQVRVLRASVMSPRIFWYDFRRAFASLFRFSLIAGLVVAAVWGVWRGIESGLLENEDFRLRQIVLNDNPAIDEIRLLEVTKIDLEGSLFDCDPDRIRAQLLALPEVASADVVREFPGELIVDVRIRKPYVWVACESAGIRSREVGSGLLVDRNGRLFPATAGMMTEAAALPVIHLRNNEGVLTPGERIDHPDFHRALRLLQVAERQVPEAMKWVESIELHKSWGCKLHTRDAIEATFGHDDLERQMTDFLSAVEHAREKGDRLATISLVGRRNLPVTFHSTAAPRAVVVPEPEPETTGDQDLRQIIER